MEDMRGMRKKERDIIEFRGYWRAGNERDLPAEGGVYCVYEAKMVLATGKLTPLKLIYIGSAENIKKQIINHPSKDKWKEHVGRDHHMCYSFAPVEAAKRKYIEAALVFAHKPPANTMFKDTFPYDRVHVLVSGNVGLLKPFVTVRRKG
jgi:excinuclease UvrABC nuclease subunit